jgi:serine phosphatase RsbU (regulator of sigma subunit)
MNRAVYAAARGELQMTFFAGALDGESGILRYANASHEAVIVAPRPDPSRKSGPRELRHLIEARGPRLGEGLEATFPEAEVQVERGQSLFVYSDGVQDVRDLKDAPWPERVFLKAVADAANDSSSAEGFLKVFNKRLEEHRQNVPLKDDLSYFVVSYGGVSSKDTRNPSV